MRKSSIASDYDLDVIRDLLTRRAGESEGIDFEEHVRIPEVRSVLRVWKQNEKVIGFAYVDGYCNLWFDAENTNALAENADEMAAWGNQCMRQRNQKNRTNDSLDYSCRADQIWRIELLQRHGFTKQSIRTIKYSLPLGLTINQYPFPPGFTYRSVNKNDLVEDLVELHRTAFGTDHMTVAERRAIMQSPLYIPELDLLAIAPAGALAAFCLGGFNDVEKKVAYTNPIGTHPRYQRFGLAKALVSVALLLVRNSGAEKVEIGTSSENIPMNRLACSLGFHQVSEKLWFSKTIT